MSKKRLEKVDDIAHVLFTELVICERDGDIFYAGGRSNKYRRTGAMTADYVRALVSGLSQLLAEYEAERGITPPPLDGVELTRDGDVIAFVLSHNGKPHSAGRVTRAAARKAKAWLDEFFDGPNLVRLRRRASDALVWAVLLTPAMCV